MSNYNSNNSYAKSRKSEKTSNKKSYKTDIKCAYDKGYIKGWEDAYKIPSRPGARLSAAQGYYRGVRNHRKSDKYTAKYSKSKQKYN